MSVATLELEPPFFFNFQQLLRRFLCVSFCRFLSLIFFIFFNICGRLGASLSLAVSMMVKLFSRVGGMIFSG